MITLKPHVTERLPDMGFDISNCLSRQFDDKSALNFRML